MNNKLIYIFVASIVLLLSSCIPEQAVKKEQSTATEALGAGFTTEIDEPSVRGRLSRITGDQVDVRYSFTISPDGESIVYSGLQKDGLNEQIHLWSVSAEGNTAPVKLTSGGYNDYTSPSFTPDGNFIVYASDGNIWKINKDGAGGKVKIPGSSGIDFAPNVSSSGKVVFTSLLVTDTDVKSIIWTSNLNGGSLTQIREGRYPKWSPDGEKIVFDYEGDIWLIDKNGRNLTQLTNTQDIVEALPSFSSNGEKIIFTASGSSSDVSSFSNSSGRGWRVVGDENNKNNTQTTTRNLSQNRYYSSNDFDIWSMNIDGTEKAQITELESWDSWPIWTNKGIYFSSGRAQTEDSQITRIWFLREL